MAKFLTTNGISSYIENIIKDAKKEVYLVSPYLQLSQSFVERLQDAQDHNVKITIVYGKSDLKSSEMDILKGLSNLTLYFSKNLHAKCYFNESSMVITSMNMYEFSEKNNREMGVYITNSEDKELYDGGFKETSSIIRSAETVQITTPIKSSKSSNKNKKTAKKKKSDSGCCIRCEDNIPLNLNSPYCKKCYKSWSFYENEDFEEKVCHGCGKDNYSTMLKPVCYKCYKSLN
tara:strand:+ start:18457 stop:19152 length:696 start_codon:yes stop_codon:yes gene_type:complete